MNGFDRWMYARYGKWASLMAAVYSVLIWVAIAAAFLLLKWLTPAS